MPLSPQGQRERRERIKRLSDPPKLRQIHCRNCGKRSSVPPNVQVKLFCSPLCKAEYHRHGSAFGPLKTKLENLVKRYMNSGMAVIYAAQVEQVADLEKRVAALEENCK